MKPIFAIDPGPEKSAYLEYDPGKPQTPIVRHGHMPNGELLERFTTWAEWKTVGVIEVMQSYMLRVGASVFLTCEWIGRFDNEWHGYTNHLLQRLTKPEVSNHLCGRRNASKADLHGALYVKFGDGSRRSAVGVKKAPGPLYGLTGDHVWDALALAVTWHEQNQATTERTLR